ncbi:MAG: two-component system, NtrC family, sensor kinase, partial [Campylobacterota bacterium]|nr:two-component system, NtrC family, sensor kinase [Campylobacterota bacterium]
EKKEREEFVSLRQDITELEEYKNELEKKEKEEIEKRETQENILIRQSRMAEMGEMLGVIAHQWKQPLNTLFLIVQDVKLAYEAKELDAKYIDEMTENALRSVTFMSETIDDFRNFFKPEQEKEAFCINDSILMIEKILSLQIQQLSITLIKNIDKKLYAFGYQNEFKQVLLNIINNSKDAIKEHNPKSRDNKIIIDAFEEDRWVVVRVSDTGGGIPDGVIDRIFDNYFSTKSKDVGTGLGLYMAKTIIEKKMNGILSASNIKDGAAFTIKLPKALR